MRVLDLFSGIGGFSLGLERAGMTTAMFCEIEPYCRRVLAKHWPGVPIHDDIRTLDRMVVAEKAGPVDLVCGGFPCTDISVAGKGAGLSGKNSGLWFEYLRLIQEVAPRWVIIENVPALRYRGLDTVLGGLAALGYDAEWHCIPASAVGAPHRRDRVWLVAHANHGQRVGQVGALCAGGHAVGSSSEAVADPNGAWQHEQAGRRLESRLGAAFGGSDVADSIFCRQPIAGQLQLAGSDPPGGNWEADPADAHGSGPVESYVGRVAYGVPARVDRLRALGNAVVPQIPEILGRAIMTADARLTAPRQTF